jgi:hypothetical protein
MKYRYLHTRLDRLEAAVFPGASDLHTFTMQDGQTIVLSRDEFLKAWNGFIRNDQSALTRVFSNCRPNELQRKWQSLGVAIRNPVDTAKE